VGAVQFVQMSAARRRAANRRRLVVRRRIADLVAARASERSQRDDEPGPGR
jgi:hypothetical protein